MDKLRLIATGYAYRVLRQGPKFQRMLNESLIRDYWSDVEINRYQTVHLQRQFNMLMKRLNFIKNGLIK